MKMRSLVMKKMPNWRASGKNEVQVLSMMGFSTLHECFLFNLKHSKIVIFKFEFFFELCGMSFDEKICSEYILNFLVT